MPQEPGAHIRSENIGLQYGHSMCIEPATTADIPALAKLLEVLFSQEAEFAPDPQTQARGLQLIIAQPAIGTVLVAKQGGRVLGMVNLLFTISTAMGGKVALLEDMVVAPEVRGLGVGSGLLESAIHVARAQGCKRITLLTDRANRSAQGFYKRHGFEVSGMLPMRLHLN